MCVYRNPRSRFWWYDFRLGGSRHRGSTGESTRRKAEGFERALRASLEAERDDLSGRACPLRDLRDADCKRATAKGTSDGHLVALRGRWRKLTEHLGEGTEAAAVTYDTIEGYVSARRADGARGQTIVRELQALRRGLTVAKRRKAIKALPDEWPEVQRDAPRDWQRGHLHDLDVLRRWLAALPPEPRAQATVALLTGLRAAELRRLTWAWVEGDVLRVPEGSAKTRRERIVALPKPAKDALQAVRVADDVPLLSVDWRKAYRKAEAEIEYGRRITLRDLRHCYGTLGLQLTGDAAAAQAALGHSQLSVTQRYQTATIARSVSVGLAVADAIFGEVPTPATHTDGTETAKVELEGERATRVELATLSLGSRLVALCREAGLDVEHTAYVLDCVADALDAQSGHTTPHTAAPPPLRAGLGAG